ncbi:hypothetical protein CTAYLR_006769 [Chrysophaeum taylorii]|uniref:Protein-ADP-ribose hydrolase n=1 Tax=Chrysophaeum taylorii TaxID=2483200 RepID=A0AAD7XI54_9STRA|nr:hypothetical protein CTAYLR_006769 [Chrysophaeum taylorii]
MAGEIVEVISSIVEENKKLRPAVSIAQEIQAESSEATKIKRLLALLGDVLIAHRSLSRHVLSRVDTVLDEHVPRRKGVTVAQLRNGDGRWVETRLCVWVGDLTELSVDGIVNAANDQGLGCFTPSHRCVDNVIHRAAGPRLRAECVERMRERPGGFGSLVAGSAPIVTRGYRLPARRVLHVTGPEVTGDPTPRDVASLARCYERCLDKALELGFRSIAFPCISTGVFGYPSDAAAKVAIATVRGWLDAHRNATLVVVLDVFAEADVRAYGSELFGDPPPRLIAAKWLADADAVLVCAGAGMSGNAGELVYTVPDDFRKYYPWLVEYGYSTAYECMGLIDDPRVPGTIKSSYLVAHAHNQRFRFQPNAGYAALLEQLRGKDYFVYTSNVDGCFERAGFDAERIYTPQGDWKYMQCSAPCTRDSFWLAEPVIQRVLPLVPNDVTDDASPKCPRCGRRALGNVRGGDWFTHAPHDGSQDRFLKWIYRQLGAGTSKLVILEVGVGFNTPTVTRIPMEQICREHPNAKLVRVNPQDYQVPRDLAHKALGLSYKWSPDVVATLFAPPPPMLFGSPSSLVAAKRPLPSPKKFNWRSALISLRGR